MSVKPKDHHDIEMGMMRRNVQPSLAEDSDKFCGVKTIGRFFYCSSATTLSIEGAISIFAGVTSRTASHPYVNYTVAAISGSLALLQIAQLILIPCLVPKKEYEENVDRMQGQMNNLGNDVVGLGKSNTDLSETSAKLKVTDEDLQNKLVAANKTVEELKQQILQLNTSLEASNKQNADAVAELETLKKLLQQSKDIALDTGRLLTSVVQRNADLSKGNAEFAAHCRQLEVDAARLNQLAKSLDAGNLEYQRQNEALGNYVAALKEAAKNNDAYMAKVKGAWDAVLSKLSQDESQIVQLQANNASSEKKIQGQIDQLKQLIKELGEVAPQFKPLLDKLSKIEKKQT